jgi:hypothetical protein
MSRVPILSPNGVPDEPDHRTYQSLSSIPGEPAADPPASLKSMASNVPGSEITYFRANMMILSLGVLVFLQGMLLVICRIILCNPSVLGDFYSIVFTPY